MDVTSGRLLSEVRKIRQIPRQALPSIVIRKQWDKLELVGNKKRRIFFEERITRQWSLRMMVIEVDVVLLCYLMLAVKGYIVSASLIKQIASQTFESLWSVIESSLFTVYSGDKEVSRYVGELMQGRSRLDFSRCVYIKKTKTTARTSRHTAEQLEERRQRLMANFDGILANYDGLHEIGDIDEVTLYKMF